MRRVALLLMTALVLSACSTAEPRVNYVFDCVTNVQQPKELTVYCADGGQIIQDIRWFNWTDLSATGEGIAYTNQCDPNCAEGQIQRSKVKITLLDVQDIDGISMYTTLQLLYTDPPKGRQTVENVALATGK